MSNLGSDVQYRSSQDASSIADILDAIHRLTGHTQFDLEVIAELADHVDTFAQRVTEVPTESSHLIYSALLAARQLNNLEQCGYAIVLAEAALAWAEQRGYPKLCRAALMNIGIAGALTMNISLALNALNRSLEIAQELNESLFMAVNLIAIGEVFRYAGLYKEALLVIEQTHTIVCNAPDIEASKRAKMQVSLHQNKASVLLALHRPFDALEASEAALKFATAYEADHESDMVMTEAYAAHARALLQLKRYDDALFSIECMKFHANSAEAYHAQAIAEMTLALFEAHHQKFDMAFSRIAAIKQKAKQLKHTEIDLLSVQAEIYQLSADHQEASQALHQLRETMLSRQRLALREGQAWLERHAPSRPATGIDPLSVIDERIALVEGISARQQLMQARLGALKQMAAIAYLRTDSSGEGVHRIGKLSALIAGEIGCEPDFIYMLELTACLNDIGKLSIPDFILMKDGPLSLQEHVLMKSHTEMGAKILGESNMPEMQLAAQIALSHHEWWDGNGYPQGLVGEAIPLAARIVAIADVFDALTHVRTYRAPWSIDDAINYVQQHSGTQFEPRLVEAFIATIRSFIDRYADKRLEQSRAPFELSRPALNMHRKIMNSVSKLNNAS